MIRCKVKFAWYDLWVGAYWDRTNKVLYVCPLPCCLFEFWYEENDDNQLRPA